MSRVAEARRLYLALCSLQRDEFWDSTWHFPQTGKNGFGSVSFLREEEKEEGDGGDVDARRRCYSLSGSVAHCCCCCSPLEHMRWKKCWGNPPLWCVPNFRNCAFLMFPQSENTPDNSLQHSSCAGEHLWLFDYPKMKQNQPFCGPFLLEECHCKKNKNKNKEHIAALFI